MNEALRTAHINKLQGDESACALYDRICQAAAKDNGGLNDTMQQLAYMICDQEVMANKYREDIKRRGVREVWYNGRQHGERENKSCAALRACCDTQRKMMAELKITPASGAIGGGDTAGDGGFDGF